MLNNQIFLYKAPEGNKVQSFFISIFDGTGSMSSEYEIAVNTYFQTFNCLGNRKLEFQMREYLLDGLLPFAGAGSGNITNAFSKVFSKLLDNPNYFGNSITLLFVSDGQEQFNLQELIPQINQVRSKFSIQFFSIAVGSSFPTSISNDLRKSIHNIDQSVPSIIRQVSRPCSDIKEQFRQAFQYILTNLLNFQGGKIQVNEYVQETLLAPKTKEVNCGIVYASNNPNVKINNQIQTPTNEVKHAEDFVKKSVHEQLINNVNNPKVYEELEQGIGKVFEAFPALLDDDKKNKKISEVCTLVHELADGNLNLNQLSENEKATVITAIFPQGVNLIEALVNTKKVQNQDELKEQLQTNSSAENLKTKYKLQQAGCYVRGRKIADQRPKLEEIEKQREIERQQELERLKEIEKQKELERLKEIERQQELVRKELERLKEIERQQELERLREIEKQIEMERLKEIERQQELERLKEIERQQELERLKEIEKQKELERLQEIERQQELERQIEQEKQEKIQREIQQEALKKQQEIKKQEEEVKIEQEWEEYQQMIMQNKLNQPGTFSRIGSMIGQSAGSVISFIKSKLF